MKRVVLLFLMLITYKNLYGVLDISTMTEEEKKNVVGLVRTVIDDYKPNNFVKFKTALLNLYLTIREGKDAKKASLKPIQSERSHDSGEELLLVYTKLYPKEALEFFLEWDPEAGGTGCFRTVLQSVIIAYNEIGDMDTASYHANKLAEVICDRLSHGKVWHPDFKEFEINFGIRDLIEKFLPDDHAKIY